MHPFLLLNTLHTAFPAFAQRGEQGGYQQQDANECWVQMLEMIRRQLKTTAAASTSENNGTSAGATASAGICLWDLETGPLKEDYFVFDQQIFISYLKYFLVLCC